MPATVPAEAPRRLGPSGASRAAPLALAVVSAHGPIAAVVVGCPPRSSGVAPIDTTESKHDADRSREADPMTTSSQIDSRSTLLGAGVEDEAGVRVVRLRGELDAFSAPSLRDDLHREVVARPAVLALDLSELAFLGVAGLSVLLETQRLADEAGTAMLLVGSAAPLVERLLGLVGWTVTADPVLRSPR